MSYIYDIHKKWTILWHPTHTPHLQNGIIDLLFKNNRIRKHVTNFKTPSSPAFHVDLLNIWFLICCAYLCLGFILLLILIRSIRYTSFYVFCIFDFHFLLFFPRDTVNAYLAIVNFLLLCICFVRQKRNRKTCLFNKHQTLLFNLPIYDFWTLCNPEEADQRCS